MTIDETKEILDRALRGNQLAQAKLRELMTSKDTEVDSFMGHLKAIIAERRSA